MKVNGGFSLVNLIVRPIALTDSNTLFLIVLEEGKEQKGETAVIPLVDASKTRPGSANELVAVLEQELRAKEQYLQAAIEDLETANEELKSTNEELQSVNEELQSTNEELETSKEELQSVNEELSTVNTELQQRVAELSRINNDMNNLLAGTGIGTVFVDHHLHIQRYTPNVTHLIHLIPTDVGRPVGHITSNLVDYNSLVPDVQAVLDSLMPKEFEVQTRSGFWYMLSIRPYRTLENVIEGPVITFVDITRIKTAELGLQRLAVVVNDAHDAITLQDLEGRILAWNSAAEKLYGWTEAEALLMNGRDRIPQDLYTQEMSSLQKLNEGHILAPYRTRRRRKDGQIITVWLTATALVKETGEVYAVATTEQQIDSP